MTSASPLASTVPSYPASNLLARGLDLLFPPTCANCRRIGRWLCMDCWSSVTWLPHSECGLCGRRALGTPCGHCDAGTSSLEAIIAVAAFDGAAREAVHAFKFEGRHAIGNMLGVLMAHAGSGLDATLVVPVPLHPRRRRERGYDQAAILASIIGKTLALSTENHALRRTRATKQQATLEAAARIRNVSGAFTAPDLLTGERILLVDDVTTTGATLESAAAALLQAQAESVYGLVFAHAELGSPQASGKSEG